MVVDWLRTTVDGAEDMSNTGEQGEVTRTFRMLKLFASSCSGGQENDRIDIDYDS